MREVWFHYCPRFQAHVGLWVEQCEECGMTRAKQEQIKAYKNGKKIKSRRKPRKDR